MLLGKQDAVQDLFLFQQYTFKTKGTLSDMVPSCLLLTLCLVLSLASSRFEVATEVQQSST